MSERDSETKAWSLLRNRVSYLLLEREGGEWRKCLTKVNGSDSGIASHLLYVRCRITFSVRVTTINYLHQKTHKNVVNIVEDLHQLEIANLRKLGPFFKDAQNVIEKLVRGEVHSTDMFPYVISAKKQELEPFVKVKNKRIVFEKYRYSIAHVKPPYRQKHASFYGSNKAK